jgi:L-asparagine transporter-like permease
MTFWFRELPDWVTTLAILVVVAVIGIVMFLLVI